MQASQQLNRPKSVRRASPRQRAVAAGVLLGIIALFSLFQLAAHRVINIGMWLGPCGFKQKFGLPCPTCGATTSVLAFVQGKIFEAFYAQPTAAFLCSVLTVSAFLAFLVAVFGIYFGFFDRFFVRIKIKHVVLALIIIIIAGWAVTLARALAANY